MPLDPQIAVLLERAQDAPPLDSGTVDEARAQLRKLNAFAAKAGPLAQIASAEDLEVAGSNGPLPARLYRPEAAAPVPTLVFFHGGGFTIGDLETHDAQCRVLCRDVEAAVLSVEYRLAPEAPFPAAVEDACAATRWAFEHVGELGEDPHRVAVGGDSAGANLAAVVAQLLRGHEPALAGQLLIYPVVDFCSRRPSHEENGEGYMLTDRDMRWFEGNYLPDGARPEDPTASPLLADDLAGLPPAVIASAEFDPLRDEGRAYADALEAAGVPVNHVCFEGLVHGFFAMGPLSVAAAAAVAQVGGNLRELLS